MCALNLKFCCWGQVLSIIFKTVTVSSIVNYIVSSLNYVTWQNLWKIKDKGKRRFKIELQFMKICCSFLRLYEYSCFVIPVQCQLILQHQTNIWNRSRSFWQSYGHTIIVCIVCIFFYIIHCTVSFVLQTGENLLICIQSIDIMNFKFGCLHPVACITSRLGISI
jgi:hypothetical protein